MGFASEELKDNREFMLQAVANSCQTLQWASLELRGEDLASLEEFAGLGTQSSAEPLVNRLFTTLKTLSTRIKEIEVLLLNYFGFASPISEQKGLSSLVSGKVFASQERVSGFPEQGLTSGEVQEASGEVRGTSGEVWETSGEPLDCC